MKAISIVYECSDMDERIGWFFAYDTDSQMIVFASEHKAAIEQVRAVLEEYQPEVFSPNL